MRLTIKLALAAVAWAAATPGTSQDANTAIPPSGVIGVQEAMLSPDYWIARTPDADRVLMTRDEIAERTRRTFATDPALVDLARLGSTMSREAVVKLLDSVAIPSAPPPVDASGKPIAADWLDAIRAEEDRDAIPATVPIRYGLAVARTMLRLHPTDVAAYPLAGLTDFDTFQGGVLFPGEAAAVLHASRDGKWLFVQTWQGPAWVKAADIAIGSADAVLGYAGRVPYRIVTGDKVRTVFTPEAPAVSELQLDMGARVPLADLPPDQPVNGQGPYEAWTISLPTRASDGSLRFTPALLPRARDTAADYLPLTRANIIRQAFKFLGERYGWGHLYNARDCSGFTSDVYRSMGVILPPNSGAQGKSPAFPHQLFTAADSHEARMKAVMNAQIGDLLVVPGHVMMFLGKVNGQPYMIQDVPYAIFRDSAGTLHKTKVNEVSVTPLLPLLFDDHQSYVDAMTSLVHVTARR